MKRIRIGKDIRIRWRVEVNGYPPEAASGCVLEVVGHWGDRQELPVEVVDGEVVATFRGKHHRQIGVYNLTLWINRGMDGQTAVDARRVFELVPCSCDETGHDIHNITLETIDLGTQYINAIFADEQLAAILSDLSRRIDNLTERIEALEKGGGGCGSAYVENSTLKATASVVDSVMSVQGNVTDEILKLK